MTAPEALRRGFDNVVANWPLILIRLAETIVLATITIVSVIVMVIPILVSVGLETFRTVDEPEELLLAAEMILERWPLLAVIFVLLLLIALLMIMLHSFVQAGVTRVYVDAERAAAAHPAPREQFRAFNADRWLAGAKARWRPVFWVCNIIWGIWGLIILMPLVPAAAFMWHFIGRDELQMALGTGCIGLAAFVLLCIPTAILANLWTQKALVIVVDRDITAREATRAASAELKADFGSHFIVLVAVMIVALVLSGAFASFSALGRFDSRGLSLAFIPLQIISSLLNGLVSAATDGWLVASIAALTRKGSQ